MKTYCLAPWASPKPKPHQCDICGGTSSDLTPTWDAVSYVTTRRCPPCLDAWWTSQPS